MRAMGKTWQTKPPYPNWKSYSAALTSYAKDRMDNVAKSKPKDFTFAKWFQENEESMRANSTDRDKNNVVAVELLPLFEAHPAGWESLTTFNLSSNRDPQRRSRVISRVGLLRRLRLSGGLSRRLLGSLG